MVTTKVTFMCLCNFFCHVLEGKKNFFNLYSKITILKGVLSHHNDINSCSLLQSSSPIPISGRFFSPKILYSLLVYQQAKGLQGLHGK